MIKSGCAFTKVYEGFVETLNDFNLSQMVRETTRVGNILDLFLATNHTCRICIIPGLSDQSIVKCTVDTKPKIAKKAHRNTFLYRRADWVSFKVYMQSYCDSFLSSYCGKSVETN